MTQSPYITGNWVAGPQFYGREALCQTLVNSPDRCIYIVGMRRVGKTSLLRCLSEQLAPNALYCDLMQAAGSEHTLDEGRLIRLMRRELLRLAANNPLIDALRPIWDQAHEQFLPWLEEFAWACEEQNIHLTFLWDEAEMLRRLPAASLMRLRALLQQGQQLRLIICASKGFAAINDHWRDEGSPFLFGFRSYALAGLNDTAANALITQQGAVAVAPTVATAIREVTGNHPYLLQLLCDRLYANGSLREPDESDLLLDDTLADLCRIDVAQLSAGERALLIAVAQGEQNNSSLYGPAERSFAQSLHLSGYLRPAPGEGWQVGNRFLEQWLRSHAMPAAPAVSDKASLEVSSELTRLHSELAALEARLAQQSEPPHELPEALSEREHEVLRLLALGMRNDEIARALVVSPNTIKAHIKQIYRKLGVNDRVQALNTARQRRLVR
jgi:DNA-binding CsgD family transcriptional regulator